MTPLDLGSKPDDRIRKAIQAAINSMPLPNLSPSKLEYWKAVARDAIAVVNAAIAREGKE